MRWVKIDDYGETFLGLEVSPGVYKYIQYGQMFNAFKSDKYHDIKPATLMFMLKHEESYKKLKEYGELYETHYAKR